MGREVFDSKFLTSKLDQCRVIMFMSRVRLWSALVSGFLGISAVTSLFIEEYVLAALLVACLTSLMILRSLIRKAWGGPAKLCEVLRTVHRELEYISRRIDISIEEHEEKISVKKGSRGRVVKRPDANQTSLLKAIRYALMLKADKMRELLASGGEEGLVACFNFAMKDLAVFSGVTEKPSLSLRMEEVPHDVMMLLRSIEPPVVVDRGSETIAKAA